MEVHICSSLKPPLEYNKDKRSFTNQAWLWPSYPTSELWRYYAVSDYFKKWRGSRGPESLRLEFLEKFSVNNFALSGAEDNPQGC